jgi:hypothetical protein
MRKKWIIGLTAALTFVGGGQAQAYDWIESESKSATRTFENAKCGKPADRWIDVPGYARNVSIRPQIGQQFTATDYWDEEGLQGPAQVTETMDHGAEMRVTMQPVGDWCQATYSGFDEEFGEYSDVADYGWSLTTQISVSYQVRKRLTLRGRAARLADQVIATRVGWWYETDGAPARCRVFGNRARCVGADAIGDVYAKAVVKLRLVERPGREPLWSYRMKGEFHNEYCEFVTHGSNCVRPLRARRSRASLPSWVNAARVW